MFTTVEPKLGHTKPLTGLHKPSAVLEGCRLDIAALEPLTSHIAFLVQKFGQEATFCCKKVAVLLAVFICRLVSLTYNFKESKVH